MTSHIETQNSRGKDTDKANYVPDSVYKAVIRGTSLFPQMFFAQPALAGLEAIKLVRAGDITWRHLIDSRFSERQMQETRETIAKTHRAYKIPEKEPNYFTKDHFLRLWSHTERPIHSGVSLFTGWIMPDEDTWHQSLVKDSTRITRLLTQRRYAKEADTLESLWSSVANVIQGQECLEVGRAIRESFRELYEGDQNRELIIDDLSLRWMQLEEALEGMVSAGVKKELPTIQKVLKRKIPKNILQGFLDSFPANIYDQKVVLGGL